MKILLIDKFHHLFGGAERAYFDTARVLEGAGHEVAYFSMAHPDNQETPWAKYFVSQVDLRREDYTLRQKASVAMRLIWNREAQRNLEKLLDDFLPDVVHMHLIYHQLSPAIIWTLHRRGIPMVMTLHDFKHVSPNYNMLVRGRIWEKAPWHCIGDRCVKNSRSKSILCTLEHYIHRWIRTFDKVDVFIAPSRFLAHKYKDRGFRQEILHVPQPLQQEFFAPCTQTKNSKHDHPEEYILYFGRLSYEKGLDLLLEAFAHSQAKNLVFVGTGDQMDALQQRAEALGIARRVFFAGYQTGEALRAWICHARASVMASACYENMPYALLEALASGVIVIAPNLGGMPERIRDGANGFLYVPGERADLTKQINRALTCERSLLADAARESVRDLRDDIYYKRLMDVYARAIHRRKQRI